MKATLTLEIGDLINTKSSHSYAESSIRLHFGGLWREEIVGNACFLRGRARDDVLILKRGPVLASTTSKHIWGDKLPGFRNQKVTDRSKQMAEAF